MKHKNSLRLSTASGGDQGLSETLGLGFRLPARPSLDDSDDEKPKSRGKGSGTIRGPRKAAEPTGDIKLRLSQATNAYIACDLLKARDIILEVIRINAETQEAWLTLSAIEEDLGNISGAIYFRTVAAALRPKDSKGWLNVANLALSQTEGNRESFLQAALYSYSSAIRATVDSVEARIGKAEIKLERGHLPGAISEYKRIFKYSPHNLTVVRRLGMIYYDNNEVEKARQLYKKTLDFLRSPSSTSDESFNWSDVSVYVSLLQHQGQFQTAIMELKSLGRWLLGRDSEAYFDAVTANDCEWDMDHSRRLQFPDFVVGKFPSASYGAGLPPELRAKLGQCRLKLGQEEEALVWTIQSR